MLLNRLNNDDRVIIRNIIDQTQENAAEDTEGINNTLKSIQPLLEKEMFAKLEKEMFAKLTRLLAPRRRWDGRLLVNVEGLKVEPSVLKRTNVILNDGICLFYVM